MGTTTDDSDQTDVETRLDRLEAVVERQQELLEEQRTIIDSLLERLDEFQDGTTTGRPYSRRSLLKLAGLVGLAGFGTGQAAADSQGQVGTNNDPLNALHTDELDGGVTGGTAVTDLTGSGLSISSGTLTASGAAAWEDPDTDNLLEPTDSSKTGIEKMQTIAGDGSVSVDIDHNDDATGETFTVTHDNGTALLTVNDDGEVDLNAGNLDTNGNNITNSGGDVGMGSKLELNGNNLNSSSLTTDINIDVDSNGGTDEQTSRIAFKDQSGNGDSKWQRDAANDIALRVEESSTNLLTVNDGGEVDIHNGNLDLNSNKLTNVQSINGGLTGNTEIKDLVGSGLTINSNSLETTGGSTSKLETSNNTVTAMEVIDGDSSVSATPLNSTAPNVIGGHPSNNTGGTKVKGATIAGGGGNSDNSDDNTASGSWATVGGGKRNTASANNATIAGGNDHTASGDAATVGGGQSNEASDSNATVAGGNLNEASGSASMVPGGKNNTADGSYSFAAGRKADTDAAPGAFVWGDSSDTEVKGNTDEVRFQATGDFVVENGNLDIEGGNYLDFKSGGDENNSRIEWPKQHNDQTSRIYQDSSGDIVAEDDAGNSSTLT